MSKNKHSFKGCNNPNWKGGFCFSDGKPKGWYNTWQNMKGRCLRPSHPKYNRYGGRGIKVCNEWLTSEGFHKWVLSSGWVHGMTIDRINNDGNYEPSNCRWVSNSENSRKKSTTKLTFVQAQEIRIRLDNGEDENALAEEHGVVHGTIWFIKKRFTHVPEGECSKALQKRNSLN